MLLYAQPSMVRELKNDAFLSKFLEEGRLLVVQWDMHRLRRPGEARRAASTASSTEVPKACDMGPGKVGVSKVCDMGPGKQGRGLGNQ